MKQKITFLSLLFLASVMLSAKPEKYPQTITVKKLKQWIDTCKNLKIIDVRGEKAYHLAHIKGAVNASKSKQLFHIVDTTSNKKNIYVIYCKKGEMSMQAGAMLLNKYNVKVYSLKGGFERWLQKGMLVAYD